MSDINDLIQPVSESDYWTQLRAAYDGAKVAWRSWSTRNAFLVNSRFSTAGAASLRASVSELARGMFLQFARGLALTFFAASQCSLPRQPATFARGRVVLYLNGSAGATPIAAGQVRIGTPGPVTEKSKIFASVEADTLQPGSRDVIEFQAEGTGDSYNLPIGSPIDLKTSLVGVTATLDPSGEPTVIGSGNSGLVFFANNDGVSVEIINAGANASLNVTADLGLLKLIIQPRTDGSSNIISTADEIRMAVNQAVAITPLSFLVICCKNAGDGTGLVQAAAPVALEWTGTWLSTYGQTEQGDESLVEDCTNRWDTLGGDAGDGVPVSDAQTDSALAYWAKKPPAGRVRSPVEQVEVFSNSDDMGNLDGAAVCVVIAGASGALPSGDVTAVRANYENPQKYSYGTTLYVVSAVNHTVAVSGTVNIRIASGRTKAQVQTSVIAALTAEKSLRKIGTVIQPSKLTAIIIDADREAIDSYIPAAPLTPVALNFNETAVLDLAGLVFQLV